MSNSIITAVTIIVAVKETNHMRMMLVRTFPAKKLPIQGRLNVLRSTKKGIRFSHETHTKSTYTPGNNVPYDASNTLW